MRVRGTCGALLLLIAASVLDLPTEFARAEEGAPEVEAGLPTESEAAPKAPAQRSRRGRRQAEGQPEEWWRHAREVLFEGIELSAEQTKEVDAILDGQSGARRRADALQAELEAARKSGDTQRVASLRKELRTNRSQIRNPHARLEEIRALLTPEQLPAFDMNRARLVAEGQESRKTRQERRPRRPAAAAETGADAETGPDAADGADAEEDAP